MSETKKKGNIIKMFKILKQHLLRSPYQSMAVVLVVSLSLFLISIFFFLGIGSQAVLKYFETRPQLIVYLKDEAKLQEVELLKVKIQATGKVKNINYVSKDDALKLYKELFKDKPLLLEMVTANILPASLEISPYELSSVKALAEELKKDSLIEDVDYEEDVISSLSKFVSILRKAGLGIAAFLLIISVFTVLVSLGMKIFQRKTEIEILKLLGASSSYIRLPLYLEGMFYGFVSAVISWGLSYLTLLYSTPFLINFLNGVPLFPIPVVFMLEVLGGLVVLGTAVGFLGSYLAVLRSARTMR